MLRGFGYSSASASHPVGSTFRIQGFLQALPVRREVARKGASKTIVSIKKLLYNYAYARPSVRFALKVLQANSERANWSYGPSIGPATLQDATAKIAGQEVAAQCELRSADFQQTVLQSAAQDFYSIDAIIVKPDAGMCSTMSVSALSNSPAEPSKIHNIGHYVSIDGRPVNPARGVIKDIVKLYKSFYRATCSHADRRASNIDPFLCMHIRCPPGSYDVNIEPTKDDVLFSEPSKVKVLVERLFTDYYGDPGSATPNRSRPPAKHEVTTVFNYNFDLLLARKSPGTKKTSIAPQWTSPLPLPVGERARTEVSKVEPVRDSVSNHRSPGLVPEPPSLPPLSQSLYKPTPAEYRSGQDGSEQHFNMYGTDDEDLLAIGSPPATHQSSSQEADEHEGRSARVTNPWSLAKLNAPTRPGIGEPSLQVEHGHTIQLMTPVRASNGPSRHLQRPAWLPKSMHPHSSLPSPAASSPSPGTLVRRRSLNEQQDQDEDAIIFTQYSNDEAPRPRPTNTLDTWVQPRQPTARLPSFRRTPVPYKGDGKLAIAARPDCERQQRNLDDPLSTQLTEVEDLVTEPANNNNHTIKPFRSRFKGRSVTSSGPVASPNGLDFSHVGALPTPPPLEARVPLPDQLPSSQRRLSVLNYANESTSRPLPSLPSTRPFTISQPLKTELAGILEFEQRKKAAALHQRKSLSNRALGELNPAKLAGIQRKSKDRASLQVVPSQMRRDLPNLDLSEEPSNPAHHFEPGAGKLSENEVGSLLRRNSPHRNRYLAAKERLNYTHLESDNRQSGGYSDQEECKTRKLLDETEVRLSEDDPRAYLVRTSTSDQKMDSLSGLTKTGLKICRTKTARLPLETIPVDANNHCLKAIAPQRFPSTSTLVAMSRRQGQCDEYIRSGENKFVRWSASSRDVTVWETTLRGHIMKNFGARLAGGEVVAPEVTVMLTTAIKAHVDAHGP